ncbi:MAG: PilZ domain-containing protein [Oleibacter sp.]|nr:PilZ domain-containing protein [Thalassolituus sp.]
MNFRSRQYEEKRRYIRMEINAPATLTLPDGQQITVTCVDISSHGVLLEAQSDFKLGLEGDLHLASGGGPVTPLNARIKVCRTRVGDDNRHFAGAEIASMN